MEKTNKHGLVSVTVKLPRRAWPEELKPPVQARDTEISTLRGRLTSRQAVMELLVEGPPGEIQQTLHYWKCCGFGVELDAPRLDPALPAGSDLHHPFPLSQAAGAPPGAPATLYPEPSELISKKAVLKTSLIPDCPDSVVGTIRVHQEIGI